MTRVSDADLESLAAENEYCVRINIAPVRSAMAALALRELQQRRAKEAQTCETCARLAPYTDDCPDLWCNVYDGFPKPSYFCGDWKAKVV